MRGLIRLRVFPVLFLLLAFTLQGLAQATATGFVFHDRNGNGRRDAGEEGLAGIVVSNQREVVKTDRSGAWKLPAADDTTFFVVKPSGWATPTDENGVPRFYYTHKPNGSPKSRYPGVSPTGPLPRSIDFPLRPRKESDQFKVILFADTQPLSETEVGYVANDVVAELVGTDAAFGVTLGDIVFDRLNLLPPVVQAIGRVGIPWYYVIGNHDTNQDANEDKYSDETFERLFGPNYYSFDYGRTHFLVLDDINWVGSQNGYYKAGLGAEQVAWIERDLAMVPKDRVVVVLMHIPITSLPEAERIQLFRVLQERPKVWSFSGHEHYAEHRFIGESLGWRGKEPHHHVVCATVSGSWWSGVPDITGIPHTTMRDGAPNGYSILHVARDSVSLDFKAARRPAAYQMHIQLPESVALADAAGTNVYVNVFNGSERCVVEMRCGGGEWVKLEKALLEDPAYVAAVEAEAAIQGLTFKKLPRPMKSPHLWVGKLPAGLKRGMNFVDVRVTNVYGRRYEATRAIRLD